MGLWLLKSVVFWDLSQNTVWSKHRSVRGNHIWVFDIFLDTKRIKILIQIVRCSNIILLPWFRCKNEQYVISIGGTKSREKWYFLNINNQNINDQKHSIFTLTWFQGLKYRHVDSCNQHQGKSGTFRDMTSEREESQKEWWWNVMYMILYAF